VRDAWLDIHVTSVLDNQIHRDGVFEMKTIEYIVWWLLALLMILMSPFCWIGRCDK
jgi:hypothetical protein